jgi:hypothetical protein
VTSAYGFPSLPASLDCVTLNNCSMERISSKDMSSDHIFEESPCNAHVGRLLCDLQAG